MIEIACDCLLSVLQNGQNLFSIPVGNFILITGFSWMDRLVCRMAGLTNTCDPFLCTLQFAADLPSGDPPAISDLLTILEKKKKRAE